MLHTQSYIGELARLSFHIVIYLLEGICSRLLIMYLWSINKKLILIATINVGKIFQGLDSDKIFAIHSAIAGSGCTQQRLMALSAGLWAIHSASHLSQLQGRILQLRPCTSRSCQSPLMHAVPKQLAFVIFRTKVTVKTEPSGTILTGHIEIVETKAVEF